MLDDRADYLIPPSAVDQLSLAGTPSSPGSPRVASTDHSVRRRSFSTRCPPFVCSLARRRHRWLTHTSFRRDGTMAVHCPWTGLAYVIVLNEWSMVLRVLSFLSTFGTLDMNLGLEYSVRVYLRDLDVDVPPHRHPPTSWLIASAENR